MTHQPNPRAADASRDLILDTLEESYRGPAWHGPSVLEALDGVDARAAAFRLGSGRNSIHELVLHLAHGRHLLVERISDAESPTFPRALREPWWPTPPAAVSDDTWRADLALLDDQHERLLDAIRRATPERLARVPAKSGHSVARQLVGMALHDTYHAGQIRLLALAQSPG